jgi:hypothetical protein
MIGIRVHVTSSLPNGQVVIGTVNVNADPECTIDYILESAMVWVSEGGWNTGGRGTGPATAEFAEAYQTVEGGVDNPALTLGCGEV